jgi:hypothetical protein
MDRANGGVQGSDVVTSTASAMGYWDLRSVQLKISTNQWPINTAGDVSYVDVSSGSNSYLNQCSTSISTDPDIMGMYMDATGTRMYLCGYTNSTVYQYSLVTPWDVTTASYTGVSYNFGAQSTQTFGLFFKPDGTRMWACGQVADRVFEYDLSVPWLVSSATYTNNNLLVSGQDGAPAGIFWKPDGLKFWVVGDSNNRVYAYTCSVAWSVSTATYDNVFFGVGTQETNPKCVFFKPDGTIMYVSGFNTDRVWSYNLSTAWNISTAVVDSSFLMSGVEASSQGLWIDPTGTKLYFTGSTSDRVYQATMSSAWNLATVFLNSGFVSNNSQDTAGAGFRFNSDGTKLFVTGTTNDRVYSYTLSVPWRTGSAVYDDVSFLVNGQDTDPTDVAFNTDGTRMFVLGNGTDTIYQYTLSVAWDLSTASYDSVSFSVAAQQTTPTGMWIREDGLQMVVVGAAGAYRYTLGTAWTINTASFDTGQSWTLTNLNPNSLHITSDGAFMYVVMRPSTLTANRSIFYYRLPTPFDITNRVLISQVLADSSVNRMTYGERGNCFYVRYGQAIREYITLNQFRYV